ncbi:uncharacterized protein LOC125073647, partial [Vanessa atalanta]|uniref:uncharacterized protein LOC125073647 n=1 Tax=Vanessa atalanta TaxID=42275 RepID=UPI001FCCD7AF
MAHSTKAAPMTRDQTMILVQLVAASKIINCKATNATNNKLKEQAWQDLTNQYNSSVTSFPRTPSQLRLKWENLKKSARKRCATMKSSCNKTGGGKDYFPPDEVLDKVASLLGNTCQGFSVEFGGDATNTNNLNLSLVEEDVDVVLPLNNDGDGVCGGGVTQEEVLKETQILETSPPKIKNFFLNRASGSGSVAKRKLKLEEEKCKARINRDNALAEYLIVKKKKVELELEEKEIVIAKLKVELENAKIENLK